MNGVRKLHETERHRVILAAVKAAPMATVTRLVELTGTSEATVRRDIASLEAQGRLSRVWGGAKAVEASGPHDMLGSLQEVAPTSNLAAKHAIARKAASFCNDGESIIINGSSTTYQLVNHLISRRMQVLTNSFPIADALLNFSQNTVLVPGGMLNRDRHNIIVSPFDEDGSSGFSAGRMFTSCAGIGPHGILESDPLLVPVALRLMRQARELVVMADSTKFTKMPSLIICGFDRVTTLITDNRIRDEHLAMLEDAGVNVLVAKISSKAERTSEA
jgi:DeoR family ulaG and ulaABCDEF operon transcriptional repressor